MSTNTGTGYSIHKTTIITAIMLVLSIMVLVVSCPLNRMLKNIHVSHTSSAARINQNNSSQHSGLHYSATSGCIFAINNTGIVKPVLPGQQTVTGPLLLFNFLNHPGFENNNLQGDINYSKCDLVTYYSKLPLFLQHHSLLI